MEELGRALKEAREEKGISLAQISEMTKIHRRHLEAIEAGAFDQLPGPVYARAFLRHYARAVGLDPEYVIGQYREREILSGGGEQTTLADRGVSVSRYRQRRRQRATRRARRFRRVLVIFLVLAVAAAAAYWVNQERRAAQPPFELSDAGPADPPGYVAPPGLAGGSSRRAVVSAGDGVAQESTALDTAATLDPDREPVSDVPVAWDFGDDDGGSTGEASPARVDQQQVVVDSLGNPAVVAGDDGVEGPGEASADLVTGDEADPGEQAAFDDETLDGRALDSDMAANDTDRATGSMGDSDAAPSSEVSLAVVGPAGVPAAEADGQPVFSEPESESGVVLVVEVVLDCWFDVIADGRRVFTGTLRAGEEATWVADEVLQVRFGRPEGVLLTLNGEPLGRAGTGVITREFRKDGTG